MMNIKFTLTAGLAAILAFTFSSCSGSEVNENTGEEVKHGDWISYYPDGVKWSQDTYDKGVQNGVYMTWHPNGTPYISGHHTEGAMTGVWTIQDSTGVVVKTFDSTPK